MFAQPPRGLYSADGDTKKLGFWAISWRQQKMTSFQAITPLVTGHMYVLASQVGDTIKTLDCVCPFVSKILKSRCKMELDRPSSPCNTCRSITFVQLCSGFRHGLRYSEMLYSAKSCALCLIFVYSFAKLQLPCADVILDNYELWIPKLLTTQYVKRVNDPRAGLHEFSEDPPEHLTWIPHSDAQEGSIDRGSVNDGYAVQVFAPKRVSICVMCTSGKAD